jgi:hypothetical protein
MGRDQVLRTIRIVWGAMLVGIVTITVVLMMTLGQGGAVLDLPMRPVFLPMGMLMLLVPVGYFFRLQKYKAGWERLAVSQSAYFTGNFVLFALLEATAIVSVLLAVLTVDRQACMVTAAVAFGLLLVNYPNGRPMDPAEPRL